MVTILVLVTVLVACGPSAPETPPAEAPPPQPLPEEKPEAPATEPSRETTAVPPVSLPSPPPAEKAIKLSYDIATNPDSRWQDITLIISDESENPLPDVSLEYEQKDIDFIYSTSAPAVSAFGKIENGEWISYPDREEQIGRYNQLGVNNVEFYPWWMWLLAEPEDNKWNFKGAPGAPDDAVEIDDGQFTEAEYYYVDFPNVRFNTFWVGPQFNQPSMVPPGLTTGIWTSSRSSLPNISLPPSI